MVTHQNIMPHAKTEIAAWETVVIVAGISFLIHNMG